MIDEALGHVLRSATRQLCSRSGRYEVCGQRAPWVLGPMPALKIGIGWDGLVAAERLVTRACNQESLERGSLPADRGAAGDIDRGYFSNFEATAEAAGGRFTDEAERQAAGLKGW
jgi:hypothetical protein